MTTQKASWKRLRVSQGDLEKLRSYSLVDFDGKIDPGEPDSAPIPADPIL